MEICICSFLLSTVTRLQLSILQLRLVSCVTELKINITYLEKNFLNCITWVHNKLSDEGRHISSRVGGTWRWWAEPGYWEPAESDQSLEFGCNPETSDSRIFNPLSQRRSPQLLWQTWGLRGDDTPQLDIVEVSLNSLSTGIWPGGTLLDSDTLMLPPALTRFFLLFPFLTNMSILSSSVRTQVVFIPAPSHRR